MARTSPSPVIALLALAACAHSGPLPAALPEVRWPAAPAAPRVKLATVAPEPAPRSRAWWRRALDAFIGLDAAAPAAGLLERPFGVAIDREGGILVADPDLALVARLGRGGALHRVRCRGEDWAAPMSLVALTDGSLLVADAGAARIMRVAPDGRCSSFGEDQLERPTGVAAGGGRIYVADPPRHAIVVFDAGGTFVARLGTRGEGDGQLSFPTSVAAAPDGTIVAVDALNFRVARFAADGSWLGAFGRPGDQGDAFARPKGIAVGPDGRVYVSDAQRDLVLVFRADGSFDYGIGDSGKAPGRFAHPAGLAVAGARLYVADSHNARIQGFEVLGGGGP